MTGWETYLVETDALLCDHAQAAEGKLFISGGGVTRSFVSATPPHIVLVGVAAVVHVPYTATNEPHMITVSLVDEDGQPVAPWVPEGMPESPPVEVSTQFNLGRPADLTPGEAQTYSFAGNFSLGLRKLGGYTFQIKIDGTKVKDLGLRILTAPMPMGLAVPGAGSPR